MLHINASGEDFSIFIKIVIILPHIGPQKGPAPLFEQIWIPNPRHVFCQVWLKLAKWFLKMIF